MPLHADPTMPPGLGEFPWRDKMHMWAQGCGYDPRIMQIRLWLTPSVPLDTAREYYVYALNEHLKVWEWLEERFEITRMPEIEVEGKAYWQDLARHFPDGRVIEAQTQVYERLACWGTYYIARR